MFGLEKKTSVGPRRYSLRDGRTAPVSAWHVLRERGGLGSLGIAGIFCGVLICLFLLRQEVVPYRPGQYVAHDVTARVDFQFNDRDEYNRLVDLARKSAPHVYRATAGDVWNSLQEDLVALPDRVHGLAPQELEPPLNGILDSGALTQLDQSRTGADRRRYEDNVRQFIAYAQKHIPGDGRPLIILKQEDWDHEAGQLADDQPHRKIILRASPQDLENANPAAGTTAPDQVVDVVDDTYPANLPDAVHTQLLDYARDFDLGLGPKIADIAYAELRAHPTYELDDLATAEEKNNAGDHVDPTLANFEFPRNGVIVQQGIISDRDWQVLLAENQAYYRALTSDTFAMWKYRLGLVLMAAIVTVILSAYVVRYQPRCVRNHTRGMALAALLLSMLLVSQLAGIGSDSLYIFAITPTILAAMILTIAYDQRFAIGVATVHAMVVTAALDQNLGFFFILWSGVLTACYQLDDIRTRSKLIEVGGAAALAMILVTIAVGAMQMEPVRFIEANALRVGGGGLFAGFIVLGILPFIEKAFRITTSMTLLELADASQPMLRRLALEAPGTYNHSLQVATLSETAADAIGANSLLCRVGSYYHDIGKINKPDYFVENQMDGENRHLNLSPSLSLRIILSHVKDGVELAREYGLPTSLLPIIQQHHGTTLVEYFYHQAMNQQDQQAELAAQINDAEYRYPGPKPKSKESAVVMIADAVESCARAMSEPTPARIETIVHDLAMKRLHDGQFDECDLTMRDLERIERSLSKTLQGIYHGRIAYPSTSSVTSSPPASSSDGAAATKSA
ncbi:MAG: HDIG domain-containing metalloprotein [Tepidisphaeraceae bacterium]